MPGGRPGKGAKMEAILKALKSPDREEGTESEPDNVSIETSKEPTLGLTPRANVNMAKKENLEELEQKIETLEKQIELKNKQRELQQQLTHLQALEITTVTPSACPTLPIALLALVVGA